MLETDTRRLVAKLQSLGMPTAGEALLDCYMEFLSDIIFSYQWSDLRGATAGSTIDRAIRSLLGGEQDSPPDKVVNALNAMALVPSKQLYVANANCRKHGTLCPNLLFPAAMVGNLPLCKRLIEDAAASPFQTNSMFNEPVKLAAARGHTQVVAYLESQIRSMGAERAGAGGEFEAGMNDTGTILEVEWYAPTMEGRWLGRHSFLRVVVQCYDGSLHNYVLEKWQHPFYTVDQFKNGVAISAWDEVSRKFHAEKPRRRLTQSELKHPALRVRDVRDAMVALGPYDLLSNNCHHAALAGFNHCAQQEVSDDPNRLLAGAARLLKSWRILDVRDGELESCASTSGGSASASGGSASTSGSNSQSSGSDFYGHGFVILNNTPGGGDVFKEALKAATLSALIYKEAGQPPGWCQQFEMDRESNIVWAAYHSTDTIYIVFQGTTEALDAVVDMDVTRVRQHGLAVHAGMNSALRDYDHNVCENVRRCVETMRGHKPSLRKMVLQGHSLGGGYAILQACDFLFDGIVGIEDIKVITFGAPQVVQPAPEYPLWKLLDTTCTNYIFAWDPVPRFPGSKEWYKAALERLPRMTKYLMPNTIARLDQLGAQFRLKIDDQKLRQMLGERMLSNMKHYGHVGKIVFIATECQHAWTLSSHEPEYKQIPEIPPLKSVRNLDQFHSMEKAYLEAVRTLAAVPVRAPGAVGGA